MTTIAKTDLPTFYILCSDDEIRGPFSRPNPNATCAAMTEIKVVNQPIALCFPHFYEAYATLAEAKFALADVLAEQSNVLLTRAAALRGSAKRLSQRTN